MKESKLSFVSQSLVLSEESDNTMMGEWSWEENKRFELALAVIDERNPDRWQVVAAMVGGKKSAEDVEKHFLVLLEDLQCIESGDLDDTLLVDETHDDSSSFGHVDGDNQSPCWTDLDHKLLTQLNFQ